MMTYEELDKKLTGRCKDSKKLANNTYARRLPDANTIAIRLHDTDILTFTPRVVTVDTGGWHTSTTKSRINDYTPSSRIYQRNHDWFWDDGTPFSDGDQIVRTRSGWRLKPHIRSVKQAEAHKKKVKRLASRIKAFAEGCAAAVPMESPSNGDCWYCALRTVDGSIPIGETSDSKEHLISHMDEKYYVPSLVHRAMELHGSGPAVMAGAFLWPDTPAPTDWIVDLAREHVKRAVTKYMNSRLGLAN